MSLNLSLFYRVPSLSLSFPPFSLFLLCSIPSPLSLSLSLSLSLFPSLSPPTCVPFTLCLPLSFSFFLFVVSSSCPLFLSLSVHLSVSSLSQSPAPPSLDCRYLHHSLFHIYCILHLSSTEIKNDTYINHLTPLIHNTIKYVNVHTVFAFNRAVFIF